MRSTKLIIYGNAILLFPLFGKFVPTKMKKKANMFGSKALKRIINIVHKTAFLCRLSNIRNLHIHLFVLLSEMVYNCAPLPPFSFIYFSHLISPPNHRIEKWAKQRTKRKIFLKKKYQWHRDNNAKWMNSIDNDCFHWNNELVNGVDFIIIYGWRIQTEKSYSIKKNKY